MSKAPFKPKESVQTRGSLRRRYNGRVQRGVFVHSAVNTAAPGISNTVPQLCVNPQPLHTPMQLYICLLLIIYDFTYNLYCFIYSFISHY